MRESDFTAAIGELEARFSPQQYAEREIERIWDRVQWFTDADFDAVLTRVWANTDGRLPSLKSWLTSSDASVPRTGSPDTTRTVQGQRTVPREWVQRLQAACAMDPGEARDAEIAALKALRLPPSDREPDACPVCFGWGFEGREAMTNHRMPIVVQWPCRCGCAQCTLDRDGRRVLRPRQITENEARSAWMSKTGGRFVLDGAEEGPPVSDVELYGHPRTDGARLPEKRPHTGSQANPGLEDAECPF